MSGAGSVSGRLGGSVSGAVGGGVPGIDLFDCAGMRVVVVASCWHPGLMESLIASAERTCKQYSVEAHVIRVPGTFELPVVALHAARSGADAVVALGVVVRGGTPHFEYVCRAATDGLTRVALDTGVAVGFGVLTCDTEAQALDRVGGPDSTEDKGQEATEAALATALILRNSGSLP